MRIRSLEIEITSQVFRVYEGQTRESLVELLGAPDDIGAHTRKRPKGQILLYGEVEFHLDQDNCLWLVFSDTDEGYTRLCVDFSHAIE